MDFESMYQRLNRSSPTLSALNNSTPIQAPTYPFDASAILHQRSASATLGSPNENMEEVDTSTRPRLTHEQVTQLEEEFSKLPKPNTDFKKNLADRIGLTLARVNNWYQNRRAKSKNGLKTTEAQFEVRSDDPFNPWAGLDPSFQDFVSMSYFDGTNPPLFSPDAENHLGATDYHFGNGSNCQFSVKSSSLQEQHRIPMGFDNGDNITVPFSLDNATATAQLKMAAVDPVDFDLDSYPPDNVAGIAMPEDIRADQHCQSMYQIAASGLSMGNLSNQTFMSATSSSDGEPTLMTPPDKPSPLSQQAYDVPDRRGSVTNGLTTDFHTFHLQSRKSNPGLYDDASNTGSGRVSPAVPVTQWVNSTSPLATSRESVTSSLSKHIDLAARRKRPRPAPLIRPDAAQRSSSFGGPLTSSPRSRKTLLDPTHPVRRVRSGLDVVHGRIQKPGCTTAQLSPRVFESCFQATLPKGPSPSRCSSSTYQQAPLTPLSAAQTGDYPIGFSIAKSDNGISQQGVANNNDDTFDFNSPPITPYRLENFPASYGQGLFSSHISALQEPPQSAPPQKTSFFFNDSPPTANTLLPHVSWQSPAELPSNSFQSQTPMIPAQRQYNGMVGHLGQPQVPSSYQPSEFQQPPQLQIPSHCPPQYVLQASPEHLYGQYPMQHYQSASVGPFQHTLFEPPMAPQPLEIKVELGPPPQGTPQPRKQYTFSNSTPDDFASPKDEPQH